MNFRELKEYLIDRMIDELPVCKPSGDRTQWYVRCPYCGDSIHQSHGHLSIHIDADDDQDAMRWRCLKCDESGSVTPEFLQDIGLHIDALVALDLRKFNRKTLRNMGKFINDDYIPPYRIPKPKNDDLTLRKMKYLQDRLGYPFGAEDAEKFQIIFDLNQFLYENELQPISLSNPIFRKRLQLHYVGFLGMNRNVITMRCIESKEDMDKYKYYRYIKVELNPKNKNPNSFYHIPTPVPILTKETLHVHIAEGAIDILGIYLNTPWRKNFPDGNHVFYGACGFGSSRILENIIRNGLGYNMTLHLYCDNDKTDWNEIKTLIDHPQQLVWIDRVYFHRNQFPNEKDYGIPRDHIQDTYRIVDVWKESRFRK